jgi:cold shock CspA family protein
MRNGHESIERPSVATSAVAVHCKSPSPAHFHRHKQANKQRRRGDERRLASMTKVSGRVAWFSNRKGYGFVCSPQVAEQNEIFVHHTSIVSPDGMYRTLVREFEEVRCSRVRPGCCSETIYRLLGLRVMRCQSSIFSIGFLNIRSLCPPIQVAGTDVE